MAEHTPGPWRIDRGLYVVGERGGRTMAICSVPLADDRRLIAAAPDLLAACWEAYMWATVTTGNPRDAPSWRAHVDRLAAAIAHATGEPSG